MPRVSLKAKDYIESRLSETIGGILFRENVPQRVLAQELGITQQAVSLKLHSGRITAKDLLIIMNAIHATDEDWAKITRIYRHQKGPAA